MTSYSALRVAQVDEMADLLRMHSHPVGFQKDELGSPSTGSEDGGNGAVQDLAESSKELCDPDEFDGPALPNGKC